MSACAKNTGTDERLREEHRDCERLRSPSSGRFGALRNADIASLVVASGVDKDAIIAQLAA